ncbi:MAG: [citrate (pro-3S)-lyase] ligase [Lachnospiraceae bacterium]
MLLAKGNPLSKRQRQQTIDFLASLGLNWEEGLEVTFNLLEQGNICATGSRQGNVLKCIGVAPEYQGEGLSATIITELIKDAFHNGFCHLLQYTKPQNKRMFSEFGFYEVAATKDVLLMENQKTGIAGYLAGLPANPKTGDIGAIVANCNPFTNGHLFLIETAASRCKFLYLFILSEDRSDFPYETRLKLVRQGTAHIKNIAVCPTGDYLISSATFPQYFLKEEQPANEVQCELDIKIFSQYFAPHLGITKRFVGSEPYCPVTAAYNRRMKELLPAAGIEVIELPRQEITGTPISASRVRALMAEGRLAEIKPLVPETTYAYICDMLH